MTTTPKQLDVTEVREVLDYMNTKEELDTFCVRHEKTMAEFRALVEAHNTKLEAAEQKVRGLEASCGPFQHYQTATKYDPEKLYDAVGRTEFLKLGGHIKTVAEYTIDKKDLESAIAKNALPSKVIETVRKLEPRYKVPHKIVLP